MRSISIAICSAATRSARSMKHCMPAANICAPAGCAVEFVNQGKAVEAYWFNDGKTVAIYAAGGRNMKRPS